MNWLLENIAPANAHESARLGIIGLLEREREREREREVIRQLRNLAVHFFIINSGAENHFSGRGFFYCTSHQTFFCVAINLPAYAGNIFRRAGNFPACTENISAYAGNIFRRAENFSARAGNFSAYAGMFFARGRHSFCCKGFLTSFEMTLPSNVRGEGVVRTASPSAQPPFFSQTPVIVNELINLQVFNK